MTREYIGHEVPQTAVPQAAQAMPAPVPPKATLLDQFAMAVSQEQVNETLQDLDYPEMEEIANRKRPDPHTESMRFAAWKIVLHTRVRYAVAAEMMVVSNSYKVAQ